MTSKSKKSAKTVISKEQAIPKQSDNVERKLMIAEAAYYRAEQRGFTPDQQIEDWLKAEKQIEEVLQA